MVHQLSEIHTELRQLLELAKEDQVQYYNKRHTDPPVFEKNKPVWVSTKNITPLNKINKWKTPFIKVTIVEPVGTHAYRVVFPAHHSRLHDVVNITYLEPYVKNKFPDREPKPPKPVLVDGEEEEVIGYIKDSVYTTPNNPRYCKYLVHWAGWHESNDTWEPYHKIERMQALEDYHTFYPNKPRDIRFKPEN